MSPTVHPIIIDTDPGVDDAMAIAYALCRPDVELVGLTTVFGNTSAELATRNARWLLERFGAPQVPVARGAAVPRVQPPLPHADFVHGADGLGNTHPDGSDVVPPGAAERGAPGVEGADAADFIVDAARARPGEITLVAIGPLTNVAEALAREPELPGLLRALVIMGGAVTEPGNVSPVAEANFWNDPHAADEVLARDWPVTIVGLDVTHRIMLADTDLDRLGAEAGETGAVLRAASRFYVDFYTARAAELDPAAADSPALRHARRRGRGLRADARGLRHAARRRARGARWHRGGPARARSQGRVVSRAPLGRPPRGGRLHRRRRGARARRLPGRHRDGAPAVRRHRRRAAILALVAAGAASGGCDWVDSTGVQPGEADGGEASQALAGSDVALDEVAPGEGVGLREDADATLRLRPAAALDGRGAPLRFDWSEAPLAEGALDACASIEGFDPGRAPGTLAEACTDADDCGFSFEPADAADGAGFALRVPRLRAPLGRRHALVGVDVEGVERYRREFDLCLVAINEAPVAADDVYETVGDGTLEIDAERGVLANDEDDVDTANAALVVSAGPLEGPANAEAFELRSDGGFTWRPVPSPDGEIVEDGFRYEITDGLHVSSASVSLRAVFGALHGRRWRSRTRRR